MTTQVRVYVPLKSDELGQLATAGTLTCPREGHIVSDQLRAQWSDFDDEELEYAVLQLAADESRNLSEITGRRCVVVASIPASAVAEGGDLTRVEVHELRRGWVAALHLDVAEGAGGDDDLAWFAPSELELISGGQAGEAGEAGPREQNRR